MNKKLLFAITIAMMFLTGSLSAQTLFTEDFESSTQEQGPTGWTLIDADGDGYNWVVRGGTTVTPHGGAQLVASESYINNLGALTPDNWMISGPIEITSEVTLSWWVQAQDGAYPADKYGVYISTTDASSTNNFDEVFVEVLTAKSKGVKKTRGTNESGNWYKRNVSLAEYVGETIYIAFRHYDCTDNFVMNIDDIKIAAASAPAVTDYSYDFEDAAFEGAPTGFKLIDADGDGYNWAINPSTGYTPHSGTKMSISESYYKDPVTGSGTALTPDNWMITPAFTVSTGSDLSWWVQAQDASYAAEHYGVYITTVADPVPSDFTKVFEETMTAKSGEKFVQRKERGANALGNWYKRTVNLADYYGQTIRVGFRHFDCSDEFILNIDDIKVGRSGSIEAPADVTAVATGANVTVTWTAVGTAESYNVYCNGSLLENTTSTSVTYKDLARGEYCYTVKSVNEESDESEASDESCVDVNSNILLINDFESLGQLADWEIIDADGDGENWGFYKDIDVGWLWEDILEGHSGTGFMGSASAESTPDNWLITPKINIGNDDAFMTYFVSAYSGSYYAEHYAVYAFSADDLSDTVRLFEETLGAKNTLREFGKLLNVKSNTKAEVGFPWTGRQVDLSQSGLSGQIRIAFRHFNCEDQSYLFLDDVNVLVGEPYHFEGPELSGSVYGKNTAKLTWSKIEGADNYMVYLNGDILKTLNANQLSFYHTGLTNGTYSYTVAAANEFTVGEQSDAVEIEITESPIFLQESFETVTTSAPFTLPEGWTQVDADGDGNMWEGTIQDANNGKKCMITRSYYSGALTPDNWLITPAIEVSEAMTLFYSVKNYSSSWRDTYGVFISTTYADDNSLEGFTDTIVIDTPVSSWTQMSFDLSDYEGQTINIAFRHFNCSDQFYLYLDDVVLVPNSAMECGIPENIAVEPYAYSAELTWDAVEGAKLYRVYNVADNAVLYEGGANYCTITGLDPESDYSFAVSAICEYGEGELSEPVEFTTNASNVSISDFILNESFEDMPTQSVPEGWTVYDEDGDTNNWYSLVASGDIPGHTGVGLMTSASYNGSVLHPDNWLVTPMLSIADGHTLSYWVCGQDAAYPAEHYGVYISTENSVASFTKLFEETLTAKTTKAARPRGLNEQGTWYNRTIDLSEYAGQDVYIAFRHFNCYDEFRLNLDDVVVAKYEGSNAVDAPELTANLDVCNVELSWSEVDGAVSYAIYQSVNGGDTLMLVNKIKGTEYVVEGLADGSYCYAVVANGEMEVSEKSNVECVTVNAGRTNIFFEDFETVKPNGYIDGWVIVDADGDDNNWYGINSSTIVGHSGNGLMTSASYASVPLTPDNWLITPAIELTTWNNILSFYVSAQDVTAASERYGVYVSTTDTDPDSFTELMVETLGAKAQGNWYYKTIDLGQYMGQTIYIGFRHFGCTDMFRINLDDVRIVGSPTAIDDVVDNAISVFPIPAKDVLNVTTTKNFDNYEIYNVVGQVVSRNVVNNNTFQVNTSTLNKGIYFIRMSGNGATSVAKFVVE